MLASIKASQETDPISVLMALRKATHAKHAVLDHAMPLAKTNASVEEYCAHLELLLAWLKPLECWLNNFTDGPQGAAAPDFVWRSALIESDLADIGGGKFRLPQDTLAAWPRDSEQAYRWGICYVIEGAQLGGAVLYRQLSTRLAPHPLRYLKGDDESVGRRWQCFLAVMETSVQGHRLVNLAVQGAIDAFDALLRQLGEPK